MLGCRVFFAQHRFQKRICSALERAPRHAASDTMPGRAGYFSNGAPRGVYCRIFLVRAALPVGQRQSARLPDRGENRPCAKDLIVCWCGRRRAGISATRRQSQHTRAHTHQLSQAHTRTADTHNCTHTQTRTNTQTRTHARINRRARPRTHEHARTHARARPRTHACTHTHARTHARAARFQVPAALRRAHGMAIHIGRHASVAHAAHVSSHTCADARTCAAHLQSIAHTCKLTTPHTTQNKKRAAIRRSHRTARRSASQWHGLTID